MGTSEYPQLEILHEDNHLLICNKPPNMPSQSDESGDIDLVSTAKEYLKKKYSKKGNVYLGLVHRIDRPASGIVIAARTSKAASRMAEQMREHRIIKQYSAVVHGVPSQKKKVLTHWLVKNSKTNTSAVAGSDIPDAKFSELTYSVRETVCNVIEPGKNPMKTGNARHEFCIDSLSLLEIALKTGRPHQIRVQFSHEGFPVYGDGLYGPHNTKTSSLALFSRSVTFTHPVSGKNMSFSLPLPEVFPWNLFKFSTLLENHPVVLFPA